MNNNHFYCVIMAGGTGTRFWPLSRESKPKQFLPLSMTGKSFIRLAYERFEKIIPKDHILVVSQTRYLDLVKEHLPEVPDSNIILEPYSRNTAPCIATATYALLKRDPEAVMVATPADHIILDDENFQHTIKDALDFASRSDALITLGIVPDHPDTNFGYIQGIQNNKQESNKPLKVKTFTEKPNAELAEIFYLSGEFFWNSGIFVWKAQSIREELEKHMPEVKSLYQGWETAFGTSQEEQFLENTYSSITKISIDYAVMEKTDKAWVYPSNFRWNDIGTWEAMYSYISKVKGDNNVYLCGPLLENGNNGTIVCSSNNKKLLVVKGLENYIVVDTDDVLMICPRDKASVGEVIANIAMPDYEDFR